MDVFILCIGKGGEKEKEEEGWGGLVVEGVYVWNKKSFSFDGYS